MAGSGANKKLEFNHMFFAFVPSKELKARENGQRKTR
jgi:hypothetical protein